MGNGTKNIPRTVSKNELKESDKKGRFKKRNTKRSNNDVKGKTSSSSPRKLGRIWTG